jgi:hypothetical protein
LNVHLSVCKVTKMNKICKRNNVLIFHLDNVSRVKMTGYFTAEIHTNFYCDSNKTHSNWIEQNHFVPMVTILLVQKGLKPVLEFFQSLPRTSHLLTIDFFHERYTCMLQYLIQTTRASRNVVLYWWMFKFLHTAKRKKCWHIKFPP